MKTALKDAIRWITRDNHDGSYTLVLQVLHVVRDIDNTGQGTYDEEWVDVPVVPPTPESIRKP